MHPSKVTLRPKVRRPMAWDSTKSAPSAQQPEPSTQCRIPGGYRRAETRHHRIDHPARLREDAQQQDMIAAIPLRHCALRATDAVSAQPDASDAIPSRYCASRAETRRARALMSRVPMSPRRQRLQRRVDRRSVTVSMARYGSLTLREFPSYARPAKPIEVV